VDQHDDETPGASIPCWRHCGVISNSLFALGGNPKSGLLRLNDCWCTSIVPREKWRAHKKKERMELFAFMARECSGPSQGGIPFAEYLL
jgi:hypothetical protein